MYDIEKLRFWCQKVMPLVYEDSLSYYETLCKVIKKLNEVIESVDGIPDLIAEMLSDEHIGEIVIRLLNNLEEQIASANEELSETATADRGVGTLVWLNGDLYRATKYIDAGDRYVAGGNVEKITVEEVIKDLQLAFTDNYEDGERVASADREVGELVWFKNELLLVKEHIDEGNAYTDANSEVVDFSSLFLTIENAISSEATARANADTALGQRITDEATARENADTALGQRITNEATARANADTDLNSKIGELADLDTSVKTSAVDAINEVLEIAQNPLNALTPDDFTGTDGEKMQSAFDALALTGGTIVLTRAYTLDRNILIQHRTTVPNHKTITVIGIGETAEINFDEYSILGYDTNYVDYGGLEFLNVKIHGSGKAFITDNLIRIHLNACAIWSFDYVFYGTDYSQSVYVNDCTINQIQTCVMYVLRYAWDTHFSHNRIELCSSVFNVNVANTATFSDNVIESYRSDTPLNRKQFIIRTIARAFLIEGNYFEDNECTIDLTDMTNDVINTVSIRDNMFIEPSRNTGAICIKLPNSAITNASIMIENNSFALRDSSQYAISVTGSHTLTNIVVNNCHGEQYQVYDPDHMLHDLANYNNDIFTRNVDATNNTAIPPEFRRFGKYCMFNGTVTLNQNVNAGAAIFTLGSVYNAPPTQRFGTIYKMSGGTIASTHRANIEADGHISCQEALSSGDVVSFVCNWVSR